LIKKKMFEAAVLDLNRAVELDPLYAQAYWARGKALAGLARRREAVQDYSKALDLGLPDAYLKAAYYNRGLAYRLMDKPKLALDDFSRVLEIDPREILAYTNRGLAYEQMGRSQLALAEYQKALELDPANQYALEALKKIQPQAARAGLEADPVLAVRSVNGLALDLYERFIGDGGGNLLFSPFSIGQALALAHAGSSGETADQISRMLHYDKSPQTMYAAHGALKRHLLEAANLQDQELLLANAVWLREGLPPHEAYSSLVRGELQSGLMSADFSRPGPAAGKINRWVSEQTRGAIAQLVEPDSVARARMIITDAVYYLGQWREPFLPEGTSVRPFWLNSTQTTLVKLMRRRGTFAYFEDQGLQAVRLPYLNGRLNFLLFLPREKEGLGDLESSLPEVLQKVHQGLAPGDVSLYLPRFSSEMRMNLNSALIKLGLDRAFSNAAEIDRVAQGGPLSISAVIHTALLTVQENGSAAGAATDRNPAGQSGEASPKPKVVRADHPFIYLIEDEKTGCILLMGRLIKPRLE
jgi:serpin B